VKYAADGLHLAEVAEPRPFETPHQSPQLFLWEHADRDWVKVLRVPAYAPRKRQIAAGVQGCLFLELEEHHCQSSSGSHYR
jgi:hypothetical protein